MNGDHKALCPTKRHQEMLRVLPSSLVDSLEKDNAMEEGLEGARRAAGCAREEGSEAEGRSRGQEHCGHSIHLQLYVILLEPGCETRREGDSEARAKERAIAKEVIEKKKFENPHLFRSLACSPFFLSASITFSLIAVFMKPGCYGFVSG